MIQDGDEHSVASPAKPVVLIAEKLAQSAMDVLGSDFEIRYVDGADRAALLPALADADAVLIRSATTIDAEALAAAPNLKVVARAGIGLDNVDVPASTARGVLVVNAPQSNIITAAEHAIALLLSVARQIPAAHATMAAGEWKRSKFVGVEIAEKTVGVVGLGRIGQLFAARIAAFGTNVIAYDPYLQPARAAALGVQLVDLPTLLREADIISIHLPKTPETLGLIGAAELATVKPTVLIVNAARGGLIDEQALADALTEGRVAGAGIDVYVKEPMTAENPLRSAPNIVLTPHLGASTEEAQDKAGHGGRQIGQVGPARGLRAGRRERGRRRPGRRRGAPVDSAGLPARFHPHRRRRRGSGAGGGRGPRRSGRFRHHDPAVGGGSRHLRPGDHRCRHVRQRPGPGRRTRTHPVRHLDDGNRGLPVVHHTARGHAGRFEPLGLRHPVRIRTRSPSSSRSTIGTSTYGPKATWCSSPTPTGRA